MQNKNIVIGIGNLLFCDDGVGIIAVEYLKNNYTFSDELELLDGGTLGFNLAEYFLSYDNVFIVDTISTDDEAGTIYEIPSNELLGAGTYRKTAHEVEVVQMLEACELHDKKATVTIFAIVPEDINTVQIGLSKTLKCRFDILIETLIGAIERLKIKVTQKNHLDVSDIIKQLK